jgi:hypothetical protein
MAASRFLLIALSLAVFSCTSLSGLDKFSVAGEPTEPGPPDSQAPPPPETVAAPPPAQPSDGGVSSAVADAGDGDAGCPSRSCTPALKCSAGTCSYTCEGCGCVCPAQVCGQHLQGTICGATCSEGTACEVSCSPDVTYNSLCSFTAHGAQSAAYSCGSHVQCTAKCDEGSSCSLSCDPNSNKLCSLKCEDTAQCLLACNGTYNCNLDCGTGVALLCKDGSKTCNRACPP